MLLLTRNVPVVVGDQADAANKEMTTNNGEQHSSWTAQTPRNLPSSPSPGTLGGSSENTYSPSPVGFHQPLGLRKSFQGFPRVPYIERVFCSYSDVSYIGQLFCQVKSPAINRRNSGANTSDRRQDGNPTHALGLSGTLWRTCYSYTVEQDSKRLSKQCVPTCASPCDYLGALRWQCVPAFPVHETHVRPIELALQECGANDLLAPGKEPCA